MLLELGRKPVRSALTTFIPVVFAVGCFWLLLATFKDLGVAVYGTLIVTALLAVVSFFMQLSVWPSFAQTVAVVGVFLGFVYEGAIETLVVWPPLAAALAGVAVSVAKGDRESGDRTIGVMSKFFFDLALYSGVFLSVLLLFFTYTPGSPYQSYGPPLLGVLLTMGFCLWWSMNAARNRPRDPRR
ncbi:MAG TPA: hypothetical protein VEB18_01400 [Candidatus Paceibacterota bacterium]|nr:hypothetical protein [Candidatus Paceibacterota bacterium]